MLTLWENYNITDFSYMLPEYFFLYNMDTIETTILGDNSLAILIFCILLGLFLLLSLICFFLKSLIKKRVSNRFPRIAARRRYKTVITTSSTSISNNDCETESIILTLPQSTSASFYESINPSHIPFFQLPTDQCASCLESVNEFDQIVRKMYQNGRCAEAFSAWHARRRARRLRRKRTWDKSTARVLIEENDRNNTKIKSNLWPSTFSGKSSHYFDTIVELNVTTSCKEVMI